MQIRRLSPAEAALFRSLRLQALQEAPSAFGASYEDERDMPLSAIEPRLAEGSDRQVFGAFEAGALIGMVALDLERGRKEAHKGYVRSMYVAVGQRQRGAGRARLEHAIQAACDLPGLRQLTLAVNATNLPAVALYESLGFKTYGVEPASLQVDGVYYDEMLMFKALR